MWGEDALTKCEFGTWSSVNQHNKMRSFISRNPFKTMFTSLALVAGCGGYGDYAAQDEALELGEVEQAISGACLGDNDTNSLAASLAVAIADELGRWDVSNDFTVINGKLAYADTGLLLCGSGGVNCPKITALLRLQDDASGGIPGHNPSNYRSALVSWHTAQKAQLTTSVSEMQHVDFGVFQVRNKNSGKLLAPQSGSVTSGAAIQQSDLFNSSTASHWRVLLDGTTRHLRNAKSGLCLDLQSNTTGTTNMVQKPCSTASTQSFRLAQQNAGVLWIRTATGAVAVADASKSNGASVRQAPFAFSSSQYFAFEPVGNEPHGDPLGTATGVYSLKVSHSNQSVAVSSASLADGLSVIQEPYSAADKRFHWYVTPIGAQVVNGVPHQTTYQLINRRTGKCLDMTATAPYKMIQKKCAPAVLEGFPTSQGFLFVPTGEGTHVLYTSHGLTMSVANGSTAIGTQFVQGGGTWETYNKLTLTPIMAGEPHLLQWSHSTNDGPCGQYEWFDITRPNGNPLADPSDTFVQLVFAGGKQSRTGTDVNPYIAQQVNGDQVAIDPTYGLNEDNSTTTGACTASCVKVSTSSIAGRCCSCSGATKKFARSAFNVNTYICQ